MKSIFIEGRLKNNTPYHVFGYKFDTNHCKVVLDPKRPLQTMSWKSRDEFISKMSALATFYSHYEYLRLVKTHKWGI